MEILELQKNAFKAQQKIHSEYGEINGMPERFQIIEISFEILEDFLKIPFHKDELIAIAFRELVIRSHKTLQSVTLIATSGLEIQTISFLRDLVEIEFLLQYFTIHPQEIIVWWKADKKTRLDKFSPVRLRNGIAKRYPEMKKPMEDDYAGHCEIASHPTPVSLNIQSDFENNSLTLPSKDLTFVWISLMELSFHAGRLAKIISDLGMIIHPESNLSAKSDKIQKLSLNLAPERKFAVHILHEKLERAENNRKKNHV